MSEQQANTNETKSKTKAQEYVELVNALPEFNEYTYWEFLNNRKIIFNEEVTPTIVERVMLQIIKFNQEDEGKPVEERTPITLYIHSGGGDVFSTLALLDIIKQSKTPVHGIVLGIAGSAAGLIYMACSHRVAYSKSIILVHDGELSMRSSSKKAKQIMEFYDEMDEVIKQFILEQTNISEQLYDEMHGSEWFMFADKAHELGIIDEILA
jgi:ATP-dependent protease ClpP protease subunit